MSTGGSGVAGLPVLQPTKRNTANCSRRSGFDTRDLKEAKALLEELAL
jgi:hypothetical protein